MSKKVAVIMGSSSDWETMKYSCEILETLQISYEKTVVSAHRMPDEMFAFAKSAEKNGFKVIIAGAGGAAHLPGMVASQTSLPVIGVPIQTKTLQGMDSLLSIVQMPGGVPVATTAIGQAGAVNAALLAGRILGLHNQSIKDALKMYQDKMHQKAVESCEKID